LSLRASDTSSPRILPSTCKTKVASDIPCRRHASEVVALPMFPRNPNYVFLAEPAALLSSVSSQ
jgi:hypothetical protein